MIGSIVLRDSELVGIAGESDDLRTTSEQLGVLNGIPAESTDTQNPDHPTRAERASIAKFFHAAEGCHTCIGERREFLEFQTTVRLDQIASRDGDELCKTSHRSESGPTHVGTNVRIADQAMAADAIAPSGRDNHVVSRSAAFALSSRRNRAAPRRPATTSGFILSTTASSGCSAISRSTAPSPHDMTNSPIASSECYISQPRVTGSNLSTRPSPRPRTAPHAASPPSRQSLFSIARGTARSDVPRMRWRPGTFRTRELSYRCFSAAGLRIAGCPVHLSGVPCAPVAKLRPDLSALVQPRS